MSVLNAARMGKFDQDSKDVLEPQIMTSPLIPSGEAIIPPTILYCKNNTVIAENNVHLSNLPGAPITFESIDGMQIKNGNEPDDMELITLMDALEPRLHSELTLKPLAQVRIAAASPPPRPPHLLILPPPCALASLGDPHTQLA